jgi:peptidyl-prolyl cis-trans isomerase B (cyclophilin B)
MNKIVWILFLMGFTSALVSAADQHSPILTRVEFNTTKGRIVLELYPKQAPETVRNFVQYVQNGYYAGTIFHRVIPNFMIQGGGFDKNMNRKQTRKPVINEADNGLHNRRGTIAMARTADPHSATAQFFINLVDNDYLNFKQKSPQGWGYTVFGKVVDGMEVVDSIAGEKTGPRGGHRAVPLKPVIIRSARLLP